MNLYELIPTPIIIMEDFVVQIGWDQDFHLYIHQTKRAKYSIGQVINYSLFDVLVFYLDIVITVVVATATATVDFVIIIVQMVNYLEEFT